jgi:hypothetical protein
MTHPFTQRSTVEVGDQQVTVETEILIEPEALVVTRVLSGDQVVKKSHAPVPASVVDDYNTRGPGAFTACLQTSHLRFVRKLLSAPHPRRVQEASPAPAGVLATMVLGGGGEVLSGAGEEHVPGSWLRAVYLMGALSDLVERELDLGQVECAIGVGTNLKALLVPFGRETGVCFFDPSKLGERAIEGLRMHLEEVVCASR